MHLCQLTISIVAYGVSHQSDYAALSADRTNLVLLQLSAAAWERPPSFCYNSCRIFSLHLEIYTTKSQVFTCGSSFLAITKSLVLVPAIQTPQIFGPKPINSKEITVFCKLV